MEAFAMAVRTVIKQSKKTVQRDPGEKGWACYYCEKEGHLKRDFPTLSLRVHKKILKIFCN